MQLQTRNVKVAVEQRAVLSKKLLDLKAGIEQEEADVTKQLTVSADELEIQDKGECHHFQFLQQQKSSSPDGASKSGRQTRKRCRNKTSAFPFTSRKKGS